MCGSPIVSAVHFSFDSLSFVVLAIAGWMSRHQQEVIAYLVEENRILREQMGNRRLKFNDDQRRRLAAKAKNLGAKHWTKWRRSRRPKLC